MDWIYTYLTNCGFFEHSNEFSVSTETISCGFKLTDKRRNRLCGVSFLPCNEH